MTSVQNANPTIHREQAKKKVADPFAILYNQDEDNDDANPLSTEGGDIDREEIDADEIYDHLSKINDPEHPLTLAQLAVINRDHITIRKEGGLDIVVIEITPTIPHCSMATLIGLCIRLRLERSLPARYRIDVRVREGTHQSVEGVSKQLGDKERVAAACENAALMGVLNNMMVNCT